VVYQLILRTRHDDVQPIAYINKVWVDIKSIYRGKYHHDHGHDRCCLNEQDAYASVLQCMAWDAWLTAFKWATFVWFKNNSKL